MLMVVRVHRCHSNVADLSRCSQQSEGPLRAHSSRPGLLSEWRQRVIPCLLRSSERLSACRPEAGLAFRSVFNNAGKKGGLVGSVNEPYRVISIRLPAP
jgi:hypothetical protein